MLRRLKEVQGEVVTQYSIDGSTWSMDQAELERYHDREAKGLRGEYSGPSFGDVWHGGLQHAVTVSGGKWGER